MSAEVCRLQVEQSPDAADKLAVRRGLQAYNLAHSSIAEARDLAVFLRDGENRIVGGVTGATWGPWLEIDCVWVDPALHGQGHGARLLESIEQAGIARGCRFAQL